MDISFQITNTIERTMVVGDSTTVKALKERLTALGFNVAHCEVMVLHAGEGQYFNHIPDNTVIVEGDKLVMLSKDSYDAIKAAEELDKVAEESESSEPINGVYIGINL